MRKLLNVLLLLFIAIQLPAQSIFYALTHGSEEGHGTISKFDASANNLTSVYSFGKQMAGPQNSEFLQGVDGKLYGTTALGGNFNKGVLFFYDPISKTNTKLHDLSSTSSGVLTKGQGSLIYGLTTDFIFSYNTSTDAFSILYYFSLAEKGPIDGLTPGADGKFYGVTSSVIFSFDPAGNTYVNMYTLNHDLNGQVTGGLCLGTDNKLYGTTIAGDVHYAGALFSFDPSTSSFNEVYIFDGYNGEFPQERMTRGNDGKLYGVTTSGGAHVGVIYSYEPSTATYTKVHDFDHISGGRYSTSLELSSDGKFYGGSNGGIHEHGIIFSFDPVSGTFLKLHDFEDYNDDQWPTGKPIHASDGKLYGMADLFPYSTNFGKIFSYETSSNTFALEFRFSETSDGRNPFNSLVKGSGDELLGMTSGGGAHDAGVIFSYNPNSNAYIKLHDFNISGGKDPRGNLFPATNGLFYGMTRTGGASNYGVIFSFDPSTNSYNKLHDFNGEEGSNPYGSLIETNNGVLYGMTSDGGSNSQGVIFSFDPVTNTYTKQFDFTATSGGQPRGSMVKGLNGKLYGLATFGGVEKYGSIFSFDPATNVFTRVYEFDYANGIWANGNLLLATDGLFYGLTSQGGANESGVIFSFDPSSGVVTNLHDFYVFDNPYGSLIQDVDGKLYGMTSTSGVNGLGIVFSYNLQNHTFSKLQDFNGSNGALPQFGSMIRSGTGVAPPPPTKYVKVNIFGGINPYNNPEWNNWNTFSTLSGLLKYSDGIYSSIGAVLNQQNSVSENGAPYNSTMAPSEVIRYTSYSTSNRTLTLTGLDNAKTYDLEIYASRKGVSNNTTRFTIGSTTIDVLTDNNLTNKASFSSLTPASGQITVNISKLNVYNYINGFILTERGIGASNPAPTANAGVDKFTTLPNNSVQLNGSATDPNGTIVTYHWQKIAGPSQYTIDAASVQNPTVSNLVEGTYTFRLRATDNQGSSGFDDVNIIVTAGGPTKYVKVNIYGGLNPYNHTEWNNWNSNSSLSSGNFKYSDGSMSSVNAVLSQQNAISDNNLAYNSTMAPPEVVRYASYSTSNRMLTISGLDNSKTYDLEIYASRKGASNNTSRFTIGATSTDILTDNNLSNKASFISLSPTGGQIIISIARLNTYNYINGFVLTENATAASVSPAITSIRKSIQAEDKVSSAGVYPNPVKDRFVLDVNNAHIGQMKVQVVDLNGIVQKEFIIAKNATGSVRCSLSIAELKQGVYFIRIHAGKWTETRKITKL